MSKKKGDEKPNRHNTAEKPMGGGGVGMGIYGISNTERRRLARVGKDTRGRILRAYR